MPAARRVVSLVPAARRVVSPLGVSPLGAACRRSLRVPRRSLDASAARCGALLQAWCKLWMRFALPGMKVKKNLLG